MIRHIASIGEVVEDIGAAVDFYRDVLGRGISETGLKQRSRTIAKQDVG